MKDSALTAFVTEVYDAYEAIPTWPVGDTVNLGDVGVLSKSGKFTKVTTLAKLGLSFKKLAQAGSSSDKNLRTKGAVTIENKGSIGSTASIEISFNQKNAILFDQKGVLYSKISSLGELAKSVLELSKKKKWKKDYLLVTRIYTAKRVTLFVSSSRKGHVRLVGKLPASAKVPVPLIGSFKVDAESSMAHHEISNGTKILSMFEVCKLNSWLDRVIAGEPRLKAPVKPVKTAAAKSRKSIPGAKTTLGNSKKTSLNQSAKQKTVERAKLCPPSRADLGL